MRRYLPDIAWLLNGPGLSHPLGSLTRRRTLLGMTTLLRSPLKFCDEEFLVALYGLTHMLAGNRDGRSGKIT